MGDEGQLGGCLLNHFPHSCNSVTCARFHEDTTFPLVFWRFGSASLLCSAGAGLIIFCFGLFPLRESECGLEDEEASCVYRTLTAVVRRNLAMDRGGR